MKLGTGPAALERGDQLHFPVIAEVLKLSLHYGLFDLGVATAALAGSRPTLEELRRAQLVFIEELLRFIPSDARTVLDVGTGVGDIAAALAERGLEVVTLSPDPRQRLTRSLDGRLAARLDIRNFLHDSRFLFLRLEKRARAQP